MGESSIHAGVPIAICLILGGFFSLSNVSGKSGRRCHLDQLARIASVAWADDH